MWSVLLLFKMSCIHEESEHKTKRDTKTLITDFRQLCQEYGVEDVTASSKKRLIQEFESLYEECEGKSTTVKPTAESPITTDKPPLFSMPEHLNCITPQEPPHTAHTNPAKLIYSPIGKFRFNYREFVARKAMAIEKAKHSSLVAKVSTRPNPKDGGGSSGGGVANPIKQMSKSGRSVNLPKPKGIIVSKNVDMTSSFNKSTKKVQFAENTVFTPSNKVRIFRVFRKPSRKLTPGPQKRHNNIPKIKSLIEAFENKQVSSKYVCTSTTPFSVHPARAIDFRDESSKENRIIDENIMTTTQDDLKTEEKEEEDQENTETENNDKDLKLNIEPIEVELGPTASKDICRTTTAKDKEICRATTTRDTPANQSSGPDNLEACLDKLMPIIKLNLKPFIKNPDISVSLDRKKELRVIIEVKDATLTITDKPETKVKYSAIAIKDCSKPVSRLLKSDSLNFYGREKRKYDILSSEDHYHENCHGPSKSKKKHKFVG